MIQDVQPDVFDNLVEFINGSFHAKTVKVGRAKKMDFAEIWHKCRGICV